ncbi:MAG: tannase/feruloyl esterase family alpha/beta hydrolase [Acidobacteriaceae bacterium]|nr:tannase/feruloyl esterase family alpha/beta hydrolase [Acidobacteriaceae bacterium]
MNVIDKQFVTAWLGLFAALIVTRHLTAEESSCAQLKQARLRDIQIQSAEDIQSGTRERSPGKPGEGPELPAFCRVRGEIEQRTGADGKHYGIHFELNLPASWNGKFLFQGGGGLDGFLAPATGGIPLAHSSGAPALVRTYAVVSTDGGHQGMDSSFGSEQQARLDYAYQQLGKTADVARELISRYYGREPSRSYFMGCSNGGREAMMAAQRYPLKFDGVVAGNPGFHLSHAAIAEVWDTIAFSAIAPKDASGTPILANAFSDADLKLVSRAVLEACDAKDGLKDGEIYSFEACHFNPAVLTCRGAKADTCLSREQVSALQKSFAGPTDSSGKALYSDWRYDSGIADPGWRMWKLGTSQTAKPNAANATLGFDSMSRYFMSPPERNYDPYRTDFDTIAEQVAETHAIHDATSVQMSTFASRGGKMLIYTGQSDPVFSAADQIAYFRRLTAASGGQEEISKWARLFLVPGMGHCGGGPTVDDFDPLTALENWVENNKPPDRIIAKGAAFPARTRPLCAYPKTAHYKGSGNPNSAESFECR